MRFIAIITVTGDINEDELSFDEKVEILDTILNDGAGASCLDGHVEILKELDGE